MIGAALVLVTALLCPSGIHGMTKQDDNGHLLNSDLHQGSPLTDFENIVSGRATVNDRKKEMNDLEKLVKKEAKRKLKFDADLSWFAKQHAKDQQAYQDKKGAEAFDFAFKGECNMHSWLSNKRPKGVPKCCYPKEKSCMWKAQEKNLKAKGKSSHGDIYEISAWHPSSMTAQQAISTWKNSTAHWDVITGKGMWSDNKKFGCGIYEEFANCYFQ